MMSDQDMPEVFFLPDWLENFRVSEETFTEAYEESPAKCRAALKTGFAITAFLYGKNDRSIREEVSSSHAGISHKLESRPYNWCALVFNAEKAASARVCSAAALPVLACVPHIFVIGVGGKFSPAILTGLELCGLNDVFLLSAKFAQKLFNELYIKKDLVNEGKIIAFEDIDCPDTELRQALNHFELYCLPGKVRIEVQEPQNFDTEILLYTQNWSENQNRPERVDCVFTCDSANYPASPLILEPGCEGFWLFPDLSPQNFMRKKNRFALF